MTRMTDTPEELARRLKDPDPQVRRQAAAAMGQTGDPRWAPVLAEALCDRNKGVHEAAMGSLIEIGGDDVAGEVIPYLRSEDPQLRNAAIEILQETDYSAGRMLVPLLSDPDDDVRILVSDILGLAGGPEAVDALIAALGDANPNVRNAAAGSLGTLADPKAVEPLGQMLQSEQEEWVAFTAIEALKEAAGRSAAEALSPALSRGEFLASAAVEALGEVGGPEAVPVLLAHLERAPDGMRAATVRALAEVAKRADRDEMDAETLARLVRALMDAAASDADQWTRYHAIEALGKLRAGEAVALLSEVASIGGPLLKIAAAKALGHIGGDEAAEALQPLLSDPDPDIAKAAQRAMEMIRR